MQPDPIQQNQQSYDQIAAQFAALTADMPEEVAAQAERLLARIPTNGTILDLGCGPGRDKAWFEARGAQVVGADLSSGMLDQAKHVSDPHLCQMDFRRIGFATGSFAAVWCSAALLHLPKKELPGTLAEIRRVLAPGGVFFLSVQSGSGEGLESSPINNALRFFARYDPAELAQLLEQAGFSILHQQINRDDKRPGVAWLWIETTWGHPDDCE